jgi:Ala-tRNA(Pro) deacylase
MIASRLKHHLETQGLPFATLRHPYSATAAECAEAAHIPGDHLAKSVLIHMEEGPVLAVVPSNQTVDLHALQSMLHRRLGLAPEYELDQVFDDCDAGAAPPVGAAYMVPTVIDDSLKGLDKVWFEAGDHKTLIEMKGRDFDKLMKDAEHGKIGILH